MNSFDTIAAYYDLEHDELTADLALYARMTDLSSDVLILGVGTGRVAQHLAQLSHEVTGVDASSGMLAVARKRLRNSGNVRLVQSDMTVLELGQNFDLVIIPLDTFSLLNSQADQLNALRRCASHMTAVGVLILDVTNPLQLPTADQDGLVRNRFEASIDGRLITAFDWTVVDAAAQTMELGIRYEETGIRTTGEQAQLHIRWVYRYELEALMKCAGLAVCAVYGDYDRGLYHENSPRLIVEASLELGA